MPGLLPFLIALQFLTAFPVRCNVPPGDPATGLSLPFYPLVGLLIGSMLSGLGYVLSGIPPGLNAALSLALWVLLTGGLHLDGLADSADAWVGGFGDRARTLRIMKDPHCGPVAVVTLVLVLLIKYAALHALLSGRHWQFVLIAPVLGRAAPVLLFIATPYVRSSGLGRAISDHLPLRSCLVSLLLLPAGLPLIAGKSAFWLVPVAAGTVLGLRWLMMRRIGGTTGDTAGAAVEITETAVLATSVWMLS